MAQFPMEETPELTDEEILAGRGKEVVVNGHGVTIPQLPVKEITNLTLDLVGIYTKAVSDPNRQLQDTLQESLPEITKLLAKGLRITEDAIGELTLPQIKFLLDKLLKVNGKKDGLEGFLAMILGMLVRTVVSPMPSPSSHGTMGGVTENSAV